MEVFAALGLQQVNFGTSLGDGNFLKKSYIEEQPSIHSYNPTNESLLGSIHATTTEEYEQVVKHAQKSFEWWRMTPAPKRGEFVRAMGDALRKKKDALGTLISLEMGKSKQEGDGEVQEMIDMADFAVGQSRMLYGLTMHSERPHHRMYEQWHPLGLVGVISAFNFPVAVWSWNAFLAAICGNTIIWKPSSKVGLCAIAVQNIANQVMQEMDCKGVFSLIIPQDHDLAEQFVQDKRIPLISFTGSTQVGRKVGQQVAARMGKSLLELGGNNAIILDETADLNLAIPAVLFGAVGTTGQRCTSTRRIFIQETIFDQVIEKLIHAYKQVRIGDPLDSQNLMGPLIDKNAVEQYQNTLQEIRNLEGEIVFGGNVLDRKGYFVEPTLVIADHNWPIIQQETFAPILYLIKYSSIEEAITWHNAVPQGLSSAIFTNNLKNAEKFLSAQGSDCGIANVNIGTSGAEIGGAFGGEKDTGGGRESGSDAWKFYMRRQTTTINWGDKLPLAQGIKFDLQASE